MGAPFEHHGELEEFTEGEFGVEVQVEHLVGVGFGELGKGRGT